MDPNETLRLLRKAAANVQRLMNMKHPLSANDAVELQDSVDALLQTTIDLDEWLSKGGFPPSDWTRVNQAGIDKLIRKYAPEHAMECCAHNGVGYYCTKPKGHEDKVHVATSKTTGELALAQWTDDDECPVCGRTDGTHDPFTHSRD